MNPTILYTYLKKLFKFQTSAINRIWRQSVVHQPVSLQIATSFFLLPNNYNCVRRAKLTLFSAPGADNFSWSSHSIFRRATIDDRPTIGRQFFWLSLVRRHLGSRVFLKCRPADTDWPPKIDRGATGLTDDWHYVDR